MPIILDEAFAYYDEESKTKCQIIAKANNADFVDIPNKGYGGGNCDINTALEIGKRATKSDKYLELSSNIDLNISKLPKYDVVIKPPTIININPAIVNPFTKL